MAVTPIRVLLVDDHEVVRDGLTSRLAGNPDITLVASVGSVAAAQGVVQDQSIDVAIIDVRLPDGSGVELVRDIRSANPRIRCVIFTSFSDEEAFLQSVVAGASGFLTKDASVAAVVDAIREVAAGGSLIRRELLDELRTRSRELPHDDELLAELSPQERRILGLVAEGLTNGEIAERFSLAEKTVRNYMSNILAKLGMKNRTQVAAYIARIGALRPPGGVHPR